MLVKSVVREQVTVLRGKRFSQNKYPELAEILKQPNTFLLYPGPDAIDMTQLVHHMHLQPYRECQGGPCPSQLQDELGQEGPDCCRTDKSVVDTVNHAVDSNTCRSEHIGQDGRDLCLNERDSYRAGPGLPEGIGPHRSNDTYTAVKKVMVCSGCFCNSATCLPLSCDKNVRCSPSCESPCELLMKNSICSGECSLQADIIKTKDYCQCTDNLKGCSNHISKDRNMMLNGYNLLLLDGTWAQAKGLYCQNEMVRWPRKVQIHHDEKSKYVIRTQPTDGALSTLETAAIALSILENKPEIIEILTRPLVALCEFQIAHGAVKHHSREYKVEHGLWTKPLPRSTRRRLERQKNQPPSHYNQPAS